jgi:hypothetical protein
MAIIRQPAYITKSPISVAIGGTVPAPFPPTPIVPAQDLQINGVLTGTGRGKWVGTIDYYGSTITGPTTFEFSDLEGVTGNFFNGIATTVTSLSAPNLIYIGGGVSISNTTSLTTLNLPKLQFLNGGLFTGISSFTALTTINLGSLVSISSMGLNTLPVLTALDFSTVQYITSGLGSVVFSVLTSLSLASLIYVGSNGISFNAPLMTTLTMPSVLGTWKAMTGNIGLTNIALNQTSVDNLLAALAYMDGNNGTLLFGSGKIVSVTGTSSAPSNLGSTTTAGSNFVGVGTTCTVNWTGHGYATGNVLRISGITTLTNANRYAVITVVNPNQFTYTITSQSATGAGTATVVRAGTSAAALVNRGITLTTN